jgi:hypothetical protein
MYKEVLLQIPLILRYEAQNGEGTVRILFCLNLSTGFIFFRPVINLITFFFEYAVSLYFVLFLPKV